MGGGVTWAVGAGVALGRLALPPVGLGVVRPPGPGSGPMQAAQTNSLLGTSRGKFKSGIAQGAAKKWMFLFNYSEQMSRRATGLSAFRLALAREMGLLADAGVDVTSEAGKKAVEKAVAAAERFAVKMIDDTLGQYAMFNRPAMFRGGVASSSSCTRCFR